jgi:hypothetical protein
LGTEIRRGSVTESTIYSAVPPKIQLHEADSRQNFNLLRELSGLSAQATGRRSDVMFVSQTITFLPDSKLNHRFVNFFGFIHRFFA